MEFDTGRIINWGIGYLLSVIVFLAFRKELPKDFGLYRAMVLLGFSLLIIMILYNGIAERSFDINLLLNTLLIKRVDVSGMRKLTCAGYLLVLWGISLSVLVLIRDRKHK